MIQKYLSPNDQKLSKRAITKVAVLISTLAVSLVASPSFAISGDRCRGTNGPAGSILSGVDVSCLSGIESLIVNLSNIAFTIAGTVSVIFIIIGGIQLMTSAGNSSGLEKARKTITYAVGGLVLSICAGAIGNLLLAALN